MNNPKSGQSIIEVAVAGGALMLGLVSVISAMVVALRGSGFSNRQTLASQQGQQVMESFLQYRRILGWESFYEVLGNDGTNFSYCITSLPTTEQEFANLSASSCNQTEGDVTFVKEVDVVLNSTSEIDITVNVRWYEGTQNQTVTINQKLRQY